MNDDKFSNNVNEFFDTFILNCNTYKDNNSYQILAKNLKELVLSDSYEMIPIIHKQMFENQSLPTEVYDLVLESMGFDKFILNELSKKNKEILLKYFTNYNRVKSSVNNMKNLIEKFEEKMSLHEMYIDYDILFESSQVIKFNSNTNEIYIPFDDVLFKKIKPGFQSIQFNEYPDKIFLIVEKYIYNEYIILKLEVALILNNNQFFVAKNIVQDSIFYDDLNLFYYGYRTVEINGFSIHDWLFKNVEIATNTTFKKSVIIDFEAVYNKVNELLVTKQDLQKLKQNNEIILPIKSNFILLDNSQYIKALDLNYLITQIILEDYGARKIAIYFSEDDVYVTDLITAYNLWYYLLFKYYNKVPTMMDLNINIEYVIDDIPSIINEFNNIKDRIEYIEFMNKYKLTDLTPNVGNYEYDFENYLPISLYNYVNTHDIISSLNGLEASFVTWFNEIGNEKITNYLDMFLETLSKVTYDIEDSKTYLMINYLKPFHVEFIKEYMKLITILPDESNKPKHKLLIELLKINEIIQIFSHNEVVNCLIELCKNKKIDDLLNLIIKLTATDTNNTNTDFLKILIEVTEEVFSHYSDNLSYLNINLNNSEFKISDRLIFKKSISDNDSANNKIMLLNLLIEIIEETFIHYSDQLNYFKSGLDKTIWTLKNELKFNIFVNNVLKKLNHYEIKYLSMNESIHSNSDLVKLKYLMKVRTTEAIYEEDDNALYSTSGGRYKMKVNLQ